MSHLKFSPAGPTLADLHASYPLVLVPVGEKGPTKKDWPNKRPTLEQVTAHVDRGGNVGILLGPQSGIIDLDCDGPNAEQHVRELFGGEPTETLSFTSTRGRHRLYRFNDRFAHLKAKEVYHDLEIRIGTNAAQTLIPPSPPRKWENNLPIAALPEHVIEKIAALRQPQEKQLPEWEALESVGREIQQIVLRRRCKWLERHGIVYTIKKRPANVLFLALAKDPFKFDDRENGAAGIFVNPDGSERFSSFNAKSADKTIDDLEAIYGALKPTIKLTADLDTVIPQLVEALSNAEDVYQYAGALARISYDTPPPPNCIRHIRAPRIERLPKPSLGETVARVTRLHKWSAQKKDWVPTTLPDNLASAIDVRGSWPGVPTIEGISCTPIIRGDGSIAAESGLDRATGIYLDIKDKFPPMPALGEAVAALTEVISDFPFDYGRSTWVAFVLTLLGRNLIQGQVPFFPVDGNAPGCGKGLLLDSAIAIATGEIAAKTSAPSSDDEWAKTISALALTGAPYCIFDNVRGKLDSTVLEQTLTSGRVRCRLLGRNDTTIDVPLRITFAATANNATFTRDLIRRSCPIRLKTMYERPEERDDFKHPNLLGWIKENRPQLVMAGLAILHHFHRAGKPEQGLPTWGSFEAWSMVRNAIVYAGLPDPCESRGELAQADDETAALRQLVAAWAELGGPLTARAAIEMVESAPDRFHLLREIIADLSGKPVTALGYLLRSAKQRVVDGRYLDKGNADTPKWRVVDV